MNLHNQLSALALVFLLVGGPPLAPLTMDACAKEGMWTLAQIPALADDLRAMGLELTPQTLADLDKGPLAAVINLNGCTASFISADGLIVTNHHCAVGAIQRNSTPELNRLEQGFTAASRAQELWAGPSSRVRVTVSEEDVTARFQKALSGTKDDTTAFDTVDRLTKELVAECETDKRLRCQVSAYDGGARYVRIAQLNIRDVRLVHAPTRSIGVYGGDEDNWMWPRHTGDWTLFRAYVGPDGAPADHAPANVPFKPKKWLEVSTSGVEDGGFVMVAGYPGRTYRHRTASELEHAGRVHYPRTIKMLSELVTLIEAEQTKSEDARVKLTSKRGWIANYLKYSQGLRDGFESSGVIETRKVAEKALMTWVASAEQGKPFAGDIQELEEKLAVQRGAAYRDGLMSWLLRLSVALNAAAKIHWLAVERAKPDAERDAGYQARDMAQIKGRINHGFRSWHPSSDAEILRWLLHQTQTLPKGARLKALDGWLRKRGGVDKAVTWLYSKVELADEKTRTALFTADRATVERSKDRFLKLAAILYPERVEAAVRDKAQSGAMARLRPAYMAARRAHAKRTLYSDANSTLRVTYAKVRGYSPREAVHYTPFTSLKGILEKDTGKEPFDVSLAQRTAIEATHAAKRSVGVNFLSGCDTTGGNSGSPTLDAKGRLVGLLFDGNYEAMSSDWVFDTQKTRSIHVDIRYMIWALSDLFDGKHLLREMGIDGKGAN
ncbi:MAG: hypothetical protein ACI9WU_001466 [Myxococcota bacterium]|jgi:hypothetical protein